MRYSSNVVAPIQWSSPRASIGFNIFPASIAPSVLPAPTIVWSSSINRIICPSLFLTSSRTALRRSSNSPRYLAPATSAPISSANIFLSFSASGTSPRTIRCASPSTAAVLPTPGSPISTGLFFVLRESILIILRISLSLPITGSNLPSLALSTRSEPYFSRVSYVASGLSLVTLWLPLTFDNACKNLSFVIWHCFISALISLSGCASRLKNKCSTETYSSPICFASSSAYINVWFKYWSIWSCPPVTFGRFAKSPSTCAIKTSGSISIFPISFLIRLSSTAIIEASKCGCAISWCP